MSESVCACVCACARGSELTLARALENLVHGQVPQLLQRGVAGIAVAKVGEMVLLALFTCR